MTDYPSFPDTGSDRIVYVRTVAKADLPLQVQDEIDGEGPVYAINGADGQTLALVADRNTAFALARMNKLAPQSVH